MSALAGNTETGWPRRCARQGDLWPWCRAVRVRCDGTTRDSPERPRTAILQRLFCALRRIDLKPTGHRIKVNVTGGGTAYFPEADCSCPIFSGQAIADLTGNMQGSCKPPTAPDGSTGVWSLYAIESGIAQAVTGRVPTGPKAQAPYLFCSTHLDLGSTIANCWSFACDAQTYTDTGVPVATCHCPIGESPDGTAIAPRTAFVTQAGQGIEQFCARHPVGGPLEPSLP
jgi:hypothetical protein